MSPDLLGVSRQVWTSGRLPSCGVTRLGRLNEDDMGKVMPAKIKQWLIWLIVAFLVFAVVRNPSQAAHVTRAIWDLLFMTVAGFLTFFTELSN